MRKNALKSVIYVLIAVMFLFGLCIYLYPILSGCLLNRNAASVIENFENLKNSVANDEYYANNEYADTKTSGAGLSSTNSQDSDTSDVSEKDTAESVAPVQSDNLSRLYRDMQEYNENINKNGQSGLCDAWSYEQSAFDLSAYGIYNGAVGVLRVPKMNDLKMPIFLGASYDNMAYGAAQLGETSMPIGGNNTNCVIAGHRGWCGARYFVDIELLQIGDLVYIDNFWTTLTYKVFDIQVISPDDIDKILIQKDKDMVTLITCHPYMQSYSRYVVFCERTTALDTDIDSESIESESVELGREQSLADENSQSAQNSEHIAYFSDGETEEYVSNSEVMTAQISDSSQAKIFLCRLSYFAVPIVLIILIIILHRRCKS